MSAFSFRQLLSVTSLCLFASQHCLAISFDIGQMIETNLLQIIDQEFLKMVSDPENVEWTQDDGVQPTDTYELDYAEKCEIIKSSSNPKALTACAIVLAR